MIKYIFLGFFLFQVSAWANPQEQQPAPRLLIIGDSLTEGYGVSKQAAYPNQLQLIFSKNQTAIEVFNAGSSGSTSASLKRRLQWHLKNKPKYLMIALGANDGLRGLPVEETYKNLKNAIETATSKDIQVILAGMKMPLNYGEKYRKNFEKTYQRLSREYPKVIFIPFLLKEVGGVKSLNLADGIHPNEKGHIKIAEFVYSQVKGKLK